MESKSLATLRPAALRTRVRAQIPSAVRVTVDRKASIVSGAAMGERPSETKKTGNDLVTVGDSWMLPLATRHLRVTLNCAKRPKRNDSTIATSPIDSLTVRASDAKGMPLTPQVIDFEEDHIKPNEWFADLDLTIVDSRVASFGVSFGAFRHFDGVDVCVDQIQNNGKISLSVIGDDGAHRLCCFNSLAFAQAKASSCIGQEPIMVSSKTPHTSVPCVPCVPFALVLKLVTPTSSGLVACKGWGLRSPSASAASSPLPHSPIVIEDNQQWCLTINSVLPSPEISFPSPSQIVDCGAAHAHGGLAKGEAFSPPVDRVVPSPPLVVVPTAPTATVTGSSGTAAATRLHPHPMLFFEPVAIAPVAIAPVALSRQASCCAIL